MKFVGRVRVSRKQFCCQVFDSHKTYESNQLLSFVTTLLYQLTYIAYLNAHIIEDGFTLKKNGVTNNNNIPIKTIVDNSLPVARIKGVFQK